jgi:tRNA threonylcarbamoyladenosine biosynthesis protein TsaB
VPAAAPCLAIETATDRAGVALGGGERVFTCESTAGAVPSRLVYRWIEAVLATARCTLDDLGAVAFGAGPGSFTGVRVAAAVAQGLGYARGLPVWQVSSLAALAAAALRRSGMRHAVVALDARMGGLYVGEYARDVAGRLRAVRPDRLIDAQVRFEPLGGEVVAAGPGFAVAPGLLAGAAPAGGVWPALLPGAADLLAVARDEPALRTVVAPAAALPNYLRERVTR